MSARLLLAFLWLFHWLPLGVQAAIGSAVGRLGWHLVASRRKVALRNLELTQIAPVPDWLTVDRDGLSGKIARIPSREEMQPIVNEQLVVELYSR